MMQETVTAGTSKIILTSREELEGCIYAAVRTIIPELANYKAPAEEAADALTLEAAINFLEGLGYPTTPSNLYNLAYYKRIPYRKVRRRLLFSRKELTVWVQNQIEDQFITAKTPAGRWGEPDDMVGPCVFLASHASDFVNGQILYADGGILAYIGRQPK